ncbi:hypothetical protein PENTCL1PPCAC_22857, partial [Pristionchus entomophagus]
LLLSMHSSGFSREEEDILTPLLTHLVQEASRSRPEKVKVKVECGDSDSILVLLNSPPTLPDFNKEIKNIYGSPRTITVWNAKKNCYLEVISDKILNTVIRAFENKGKVPVFTLTDKYFLETKGTNRIDSIDHPPCLPGPSKATNVFLPRIIKSLGEGASAKVELIRDGKTGALFAMKKLSTSKDRRKVDREIEAFTSIRSKRVVSLIWMYNEGEYVKFIMEYMAGGSLYKVINEGNMENQSPPLSWELIHKYTRELLEGCRDIHEAGYIHMDIKPLNLVIDIDGSLKITDFGSFTKIGSEDFSCEVTPMYASPEALAKNSPWQGSCDIWSVGVTILEMILGKVPWSINMPRNEMDLLVFSMMDEIIERELEGLSNLSLPSELSPLREILKKALVIDPLLRSNASQLLSLLRT